MNLELRSERLYLRPYRPSDVNLDIEMSADPEVMKYFGGVVGEDEIVAEAADFTRRCGDGCIGVWTVIDRLTEEALGEAMLLPLPVDSEDTPWELVQGDDLPDGDIELAYLFKQSAWGKGVATEACQRLLGFAFEETPLIEVVAVTEPGNDPSQNVLRKCGLVAEGVRRAYAQQCPAFRITREQFMVRSGESVS
jgi:ribosomal-protein-alanine N-acetyltransferase